MESCARQRKYVHRKSENEKNKMMLLKRLKYFDIPEEMLLMLELSLGNAAIHLSENTDFERFDRLTRSNGLAALIWEKTKNDTRFNDNPIFIRYKKEKTVYTSHSLSQIQALAFIMEDFKNNGINALSLKGPLLGMEVYGTPELRYSADLDILIEPDEMEKAKERMLQMGFSEQQREERIFDTSPKRSLVRELEKDKEDKHEVFTKNGMRVELHYEADTHWNVAFSALWNARREKKLLGRTVYCFGEYDNLAYLICHASGHSFDRLNWLAEIAELFKNGSLDYDVLYNNMVEKGVGVLLLSTLILLSRIPAICLPDISCSCFSFTHKNDYVQLEYDRKISGDIRIGVKLADIVGEHIAGEANEDNVTNTQYPYLLPRYGVRQRRSAYIKHMLQPCEADLSLVDLPDSLFFLYYLIRPFYKLWRMTPFYHADTDTDA